MKLIDEKTWLERRLREEEQLIKEAAAAHKHFERMGVTDKKERRRLVGEHIVAIVRRKYQ